jgi:hypothetical protein
LHREKIESRLLIAASMAVPASALAQPLAGNPLIGRQTATAFCAPAIRPVKPAMTARRALWMSPICLPTTTLSSRVFLRSSHKEMPNLIISNSETDDLIAYIINLKQPSASKRP